MIKIKFLILGLFFYCITSTVSYAFDFILYCNYVGLSE